MDSQYRWDSRPPNDLDIKYQFEHAASSFIIIDLVDVHQTFNCLVEFLQPFVKYYPWINSKPKFEVHKHVLTNKDGVPKTIEYIYGELINDDEYFDENLLIRIMIQFSMENSAFIHIWNSTEYEVLLIHTFEAAQDWLLDRTVSMNRTWLHNGEVLVLNNHEDDRFLPLKRAIYQLQNQDYLVSEPMTARLNREINHDYNLANIYDVSLKLSPEHRKILYNDPSLIAKIIKSQDDKFIDQDISNCEASTVIPIHAVRLAEIYIQLLKHDNILPQVVASKMLTYGLVKLGLRGGEIGDDQPFSRDLLQNELIKQGRLNLAVPADLKEFFSAFDAEGLDDAKQNALIEEFSTFMDNNENVEKILHESDILEEFDNDSSDDEGDINQQLQSLENSEFSDFINYFIENGGDKKRKQYNNDSDYQSDSDLDELQYLQIDHDDYDTHDEDDVADKPDVLDDEDDDISPYNNDEQFHQQIQQFLQSKR